MSKGNPYQSDMSLREKQQMNSDTEGATYTGMEGQSKSCQKHLLLQVWCGLLTVAMLVMAAFIAIKPRSTEFVKDIVSTLKPDEFKPTINTLVSPLKSTESSLSYIQLTKSAVDQSWEESLKCASCSLYLRNNSIHCKKDGVYFIYALVTFASSQHSKKDPAKYVILKRDLRPGKSVKPLVEGIFPNTTESSVWVAKIVKLSIGDSISLDIEGQVLNDNTFWGAYQLH